MKRVLFILPLLLIISSLTAQAFCPNLNNLEVTEFSPPMPNKGPYVVSGSQQLLDRVSCEYSISPATDLTEAAKEGTLTIKLQAGQIKPRCPLLTGLEVKIEEASPAKLPYRIMATGQECKFSLDADVGLDQGSISGTLEFSQAKK